MFQNRGLGIVSLKEIKRDLDNVLEKQAEKETK
jgi:hypothetical protein